MNLLKKLVRMSLSESRINCPCKCMFVFIQEQVQHKNAVEESQVLPSASAHKLDIPSRGSHCFMIFKRIKPSLPLQQGALVMKTDLEHSCYFEY